ncbi:hypothetical protein D9619_007488 [Psilocybe cf. subviscida]|uniref:Uncharacterized protein n=1 Tax=Psilocybe cf. subviscida TaxID=2480587 RepID=A0A8H5B2I2_9AGAR|nr:hypothetical protein D9619_007488 [Psilocybe cf. subviscida]
MASSRLASSSRPTLLTTLFTPIYDKMKTEFASFPLTPFDGMCYSSGIIVGWLVEGQIDVRLLEAALNRVVRKWPLLGGRMEQANDGQLRVKVPLCDNYPKEYAPFILTSSTSTKPITAYIQLPIPTFSDVLPDELFMQRGGASGAPKSPGEWVKNSLPLTYWHVTHFDSGHSCIGVTFSHGLLDGMGVAALVHALEAESLGREWPIPGELKPELNANQMLAFLDRHCSPGSEPSLDRKKVDSSLESDDVNMDDYRVISVLGVWSIICMLMWHLWQQVWHGTHKCLILIPQKAYEELVRETRAAMDDENEGGKLRLSTGDVLTAWIYKTIYSNEDRGSAHYTTQLSNQASLRMFAPSGSLADYPHNCFIPIPYPVFTTAELQSIPLHTLATRLARARGTLSIAHAAHVYDLLQDAAAPRRKGINSFRAVMPYNKDANENLAMSNMSIARIVDINWSGITRAEEGKTTGKTVCRYKKVFTDSPMLVGNIVTIAGRRADGSLVVDVVLAKRKMQVLKDAVNLLIRKSGGGGY